MKLGPQPGKQTDFLSSDADIVLYGGGAGSGKTYAMLLDPLRHYKNPKFGAVIFRRNGTDIRNEGSIWDESRKIYTLFNGRPREVFLDWTFPSGASVTFAHLQHEHTVYNYQGSQIAMIGFEELTHFLKKQFFYMMTRLRSDAGIRPYIRATCNPDADSWLREIVDWWINPETGYAIPERSGVKRYFIVIDDVLHWEDTPQELIEKHGENQIPKSFTFISASLHDNQILMKSNPDYLSNLHAQNKVERERLLAGNWNIRYTAGTVFREEWFPIVDEIPSNVVRSIRFWDRAATKPSTQNPDPDWTRGVKIYQLDNGKKIVADLKSMRDTPGQVESFIKAVASQDGYNTIVGAMQDPGSAGVAEIENFVSMMNGYQVHIGDQTKSKLVRAKPASAQAEFGNIMLLRAPWNREFLTELGNFSGEDGQKDDIVDAFSGGFNALSQEASMFDSY